MYRNRQSAFTLIELSIVLVIIGLIVGGVLVGRDLISAAVVRSQISQISAYNTAVNTFKGKYGYLPGDIPDPDATRFGFAARGGYDGSGDGNGVLHGLSACGNGCAARFAPATGEMAQLWVDLTYANGLGLNLIDGSFRTATPTSSTAYATGSAIDRYYPQGKIGRGNYIYVWSDGTTGNGLNYFGLSAVTELASWWTISKPALTVYEAYNTDKKIDDGLPQSGRVMAWYYNHPLNNYYPIFASGGGVAGAADTSATAAASTTCFDNGNTGGAIQQYSIAQNNGAGVNCALSFQFQ